MQPYFFPYLGYFSLINQADEFMIFDTPQFMRKGWIERNRIIKLNGGSVYIKVPLIKSSLDTSIKDMKIDHSLNWRNKIVSQLDIYKKKSPYYKQVKALVEDCISDDDTSISKMNEKVLRKVCKYIGITTKITVFSGKKLNIDTPVSPDEWALNICNSVGATTYINAEGGQSFFDPKKYKDNNISLNFIEQPLVEYEQFGGDFEAGLSIIDVLMFNSPKELIAMLSQGTLMPA
jgi:hypothetical protein